MRQMRWTLRAHALTEAPGTQITLCDGAAPARFADVLTNWRGAPDSALAFAASLAALPYAAMCWECPVIDAGRLTRPFACVAIDAPDLAGRAADANPFQEHFDRAVPAAQVVRFANLGGDAILVAPMPLAPPQVYVNLAAFLRGAPPAQIAAFFSAMAAEALAACEQRPVWLNTAGGGVDWLHGRLDFMPKYYRYRPYREKEDLLF